MLVKFSVPQDAFDGWQSEWLIGSGKGTDLQRADAIIAYPKLHIHRHPLDIGQPVADEPVAFSRDRLSVEREVYRRASAGTLRNYAQSIDLRQKTICVLIKAVLD
jgi:hypothetical protein